MVPPDLPEHERDRRYDEAGIDGLPYGDIPDPQRLFEWFDTHRDDPEVAGLFYLVAEMDLTLDVAAVLWAEGIAGWFDHPEDIPIAAAEYGASEGVWWVTLTHTDGTIHTIATGEDRATVFEIYDLLDFYDVAAERDLIDTDPVIPH